MLKMIIADDEPTTRQGIRMAINWSLLGIEIVGEAANGAIALEMVRALDPDILICDIRMPKMDGIALASTLQMEKPNLQILFLSGYSDKEYLKTAIRLNAVDYLYKPFELGELVTAVKKAIANCNRQSSLQKPEADNDLALKLIVDQDRTALLASGRLPLNSRGPFLTLVIRIMAHPAAGKDNPSLNQDLLDITYLAHQYFDLINHAATQIWGSAYVLSVAGNGYVIHANLTGKGKRPESRPPLNDLLATVNQISDKAVIGVSNPAATLNDLKNSFIEARKAAGSAFLTGLGRVIPFAEVSDRPFAPWPEFEDNLAAAMIQNNASAADNLIKDYIRYMKSCSPDDISRIKDTLVQITMQINRHQKKHPEVQSGYVTEIIHSAPEIGVINDYILGMTEKYFDETNRLNSIGRIVYDAERYILANIEDNNLTIKKIAEQVYVTPTYLCYIYKRKTGGTIYRFILEARMKKAQELIAETSLQLGEISERLGYSNQNYFTKTFTAFFGVNPSTYRNKAL